MTFNVKNQENIQNEKLTVTYLNMIVKNFIMTYLWVRDVIRNRVKEIDETSIQVVENWEIKVINDIDNKNLDTLNGDNNDQNSKVDEIWIVEHFKDDFFIRLTKVFVNLKV